MRRGRGKQLHRLGGSRPIGSDAPWLGPLPSGPVAFRPELRRAGELVPSDPGPSPTGRPVGGPAPAERVLVGAAARATAGGSGPDPADGGSPKRAA